MAATLSHRAARRQSALNSKAFDNGGVTSGGGSILDLFAVEGTSHGAHVEGERRAGVTHAGRWCDVFEVRHFLIRRCFIYLDPD